MITHLELHRWKCFRELKLDPRRITIFIGKNGTGKSSVLQALACLKQSLGGPQLLLEGDFVRLGSFQEVVFRQPPHTTIELRFSGCRPLAAPEHLGLRPGATASYEYNARALPGGGFEHSARVVAAEHLKLDDVSPARHKVLTIEGKGTTVGHRSTVGMPLIVASIGGNSPPVTHAIEDFVELISREISGIQPIPPLRGFSGLPLELLREAASSIQSGLGYDNVSNRVATTMVLKDAVNPQVSAWLKRITGVGFAARAGERHQVRVQAQRGVHQVGMANEGFGTNQLTWLLTVVALAEQHGIVMIEEPEVHLHPKAQAELMAVLVEVAKEKDLQLMLTTHSEHILYKVLTLVAKGELTPEEVAVYEFDLDEEGVGHAEPLEITERGQVKGGLKGFFDVTLEEMDEYMKALFSRRR